MAAFTETHHGTKYARVYLPTDSGAIGTTHLAEWAYYRNGLTLCGLGVFHQLLALPADWSGEAPNKCRSCERAVKAKGR